MFFGENLMHNTPKREEGGRDMLDNLKYGEVRFPRHTGSPAGPVVTYLLNPDELAEVIEKYGPPGKYKNQKKPYLILDNYGVMVRSEEHV